MKTKISKIRLQFTENRGETEIVLTTNEHIYIDDLKEIISKGKELSVEVKAFRKRRSLDSNSYLWVLLGDMAQELKTSKDELYLQMLDRYGVYTHIVVKPEIVTRVKAEWKTVRELGEVSINGKTGVQLQCYFGSSTYDSKEMSTLLEGVVSECKLLDIETATPRELDLMKSAWNTK